MPQPLDKGSLPFFRRKGAEERPQPAPGLVPGKVVGDFRLVSLIGQGGMGQVWEAEQVSLHRTVAVKFVRPERVTERQLELFAREARAGGRLTHPGIVTVYGYGQSDGLAWIAMEFVSGAWTLKDFLDEAARAEDVPAGYDQHVARFVAEISDAMQAAHEASVIHRDLKPQNVLITSEDRPKVTDFGLARITDESAMSQTGDIAGTYLYMSPEQVAAKRAGLDHRTDVFSLGIVLYELLALRRPFEGDTTQQVAEQILYRDPPDPRTIRSRVPRDLAVIAGKALEKDRDKRFVTMKELAADLRRHLANEPIRATPPTRLDRAVKWTKRNPGKSSAAAIVAVTFTVIAVLLVANIRTNRALSAKTIESEQRRVAAEESADLAKSNEQRALAGEEQARDEKDRADHEADAAIAARDDVLRLSAMQRLDDLVAEADQLWPAHPEILPRYERWLGKAEELVAELPDHEKKLADLRSKALPWTAEEQAQHRAEHPKLPELERAQRELEHGRRLRALLESDHPGPEPTAAGVGLDLAALPASAIDVNDLAWPLVDPDRKHFGGEAKGLVLARRAVELAAALPAAERAGVSDTLAWALFVNGRFDEAVAEEEQALEEAAPEEKQKFEGYVAKLTGRIEAEFEPEQREARAKHLDELEQRIAALEAEISARPEWTFADAQDKWWQNQLEKLVNGLRAFSDPELGLASSGISVEHGWGVEKRAEFARKLAARSVSGVEAAARWAEAVTSIASTMECPQYGGLRIAPQLGLLPIGRDPDSDLWEFAHLQTGAPAERGADGRLMLTEETGLVFVLLPGGTLAMGAQRDRPGDPNYDPFAHDNESPVHDVQLAPFFLSKYEVTQGQWQRVAGSNPSLYGAHSYSARWNGEGLRMDLLHPVEQVSWEDCVTLLGRLGLSLPSEAQWEYGCRGGTTTIWWTGNQMETLDGSANLMDSYARKYGNDLAANWDEWLDDGNSNHSRVGSYLPNAFGLHDVVGNVWEWCLEEYEDYTELGQDSADEHAAPNRVPRGGGFLSRAIDARSAFRFPAAQEMAVGDIGLRPARHVEL
jgi:formylglycine-generating enzyme required for sulfatase activity/serine/threonine protein kinase